MSVSKEDRDQVARWVAETLASLGWGCLVEDVSIEWSKRFTARMGDALYQRRLLPRGASPRDVKPAKARVRFSIPLWPRASEKDRYETVVHEVCHIVCMHEAAIAGKPAPPAHGIEWKALMFKAGVKPERCHSVDTTGLKRTRRKIKASCGCGDHPITPYVAGRIAAGSSYSCRRCRGKIVVHEKVDPVARRRVRRRKQQRITITFDF